MANYGLKKATRGPVDERVATESGKKEMTAPVKKVRAPAAGVPKNELVRKKWNVEYQVGKNDISIEATTKRTLYPNKCRDSLVNVSGKKTLSPWALVTNWLALLRKRLPRVSTQPFLIFVMPIPKSVFFGALCLTTFWLDPNRV